MIKNQKGISLMKLILIVVAVILVIIFIVKMSEPQDGIGTVEEEQEKYNKILQEKENADKKYQDALKNAVESQKRLEQLEKGY